MILVVDNFDSFTYNLVDYFGQLGIEQQVLRNTAPLSALFSDRFTGVVLSPGPGVPDQAGHLMNIVELYARKIPILGICLGHQALAAYFGGNIKKAQKPMHGKISKIQLERDPIFQNMPPQIEVTRYHSLICDQLPDEIMVIAKSLDDEVMAIRHRTLSIYGLQYHPEAVLTEYGLTVLDNWLNINALCN